jgi:6-phosphogluconolactonase
MINWHPLHSTEDVAVDAVARIAVAARQAIERHRRFRIVLAGGRTPEMCYRRLADIDTDWSCWQIYFGDERCLEPGHPDRNSTLVERALLDRAPVPARNVHRIPAELGPEMAADRYEQVIADALPFDLVVAGVGEDGHTASLFPGHVWPDDRLVLPVRDAPKPPDRRVSLSLRALRDTRRILVLATGAGKQAAIERWRAGDELPISMLCKDIDTDVFVDHSAIST